jgi:hypothetical protein
LRQNDPNSILVTSSNHNQFDETGDNVLSPDEKDWISEDEQNSWILFNFKEKQISPSGYFIRNGSSDWYVLSPQGWKLEGSNDQTNWQDIHQVTNCESFKEENQEAFFPCQTDQFFSFLRFTQTQENLLRFHFPHEDSINFFLLNFVEFSGKIFIKS